jgi:hypothetical protein
MKAIIDDFSTDIFLNDKEVKKFCKPGKGKDTCVWLVCGTGGFQCCCLNKPHSLLIRWIDGETVAKRDGCRKVNNFQPNKYNKCEVDF